MDYQTEDIIIDLLQQIRDSLHEIECLLEESNGTDRERPEESA